MVLSAQAQIPQLINYQGRLVNGTNLVNDTVGLSLQLYDDPAAGTLLYEDSNQVAIVDGLYSAYLGDDTVSGTLTGALAAAEVWIQVLVNGAPLTPREHLVSVGYALQAADVPGNVFWRTDGNAGTTAGTHFVGTTDEQPLHLRADNATVLQLDGEPNPPNLIGGHASNYADPGVNGAFIGGGGDSSGGSPNRVSDHHGVVGGGIYNIAGDGGGTVSNSPYATVAGGANNSAAGEHSFIGGGILNQVLGSSAGAVIAGGYNNIARGTNSTVGGGGLNEARGPGSTIAGGENNFTASRYAAIGGGLQNNADGTNAVVPGGYLNKAKGVNSFAAGQMAEALHGGAFVWADNSISVAFASTSSNQFLIRAAGGVGINTNGPFTDALTVNGGVWAQSVQAGTFRGAGMDLVALNGTNLIPGSVSNVSLGADSVTGDKIAGGTITTSDVAANTFWQTTGNGGTAGGHFLGTTDTQPLNLRAGNQRVARYEGDGAGPNVIGGHVANTVDVGVVGATIAGGGDPAASFPNRVSDNYGVVGGGLGNRAGNSGGTVADAAFATVAGGLKNVANAPNSTIGGGEMNAVGTAAQGGVIGGGTSNIVVAGSSTVGGGRRNEIRVDAFNATIGGGTFNLIETNAQQATIAGGMVNAIWLNAYYGTIGGGVSNQVSGMGATIAGGGFYSGVILGNKANGIASFIGGGARNLAAGEWAVVVGGSNNAALGRNGVIGGGSGNTIVAGDGAVIGGGGRNSITGEWSVVAGGASNTVIADSSFIGGGSTNTIGTNAHWSVIVGGNVNTILAYADRSVIVGGTENVVGGLYFNFIGGGSGNEVRGDYSVVVGGNNNYIANDANYSFIGGGWGNKMTNALYAHGSVIGGGYFNTVSGRWSVVAGGYKNLMGGEWAVIGGGSSNVVNGDYAVVPGGKLNVASAPYSFAAGYRASAVHTGAFVWADSASNQFSSVTNDQFAIQASNGVWIAQELGEQRRAKFGERFQDNGIIAWARIADDGTIEESFNVTNCVNTAIGAYQVDIGAVAESGLTLIPMAIVETDSQPSTAVAVRIASVNQRLAYRFDVWINNGNFDPSNNDFLLIVTGR